jgi:Zn-dependent protease with chaperone function
MATALEQLGRIAGVQFRKAKWMWQSVAGTEDDAIRAEQGVGADMTAVVLHDMRRDPAQATQTLLDALLQSLSAVVRNRLHRFQITAVAADSPTAFALPGGFIFVAGTLVQVCQHDRNELAFVVAHEMAHIIRRHAIDRVLQEKVVSVLSLASPGRGVLAPWIRRLGVQGLARAYSRDQEFEADELGARLMHAAGFDPDGAVRLLQRLDELVRRPDPLGLGTYWSTHPPVEDRVHRLHRLKLTR